jgi:two-component system, sensor histidine kinase
MQAKADPHPAQPRRAACRLLPRLALPALVAVLAAGACLVSSGRIPHWLHSPPPQLSAATVPAGHDDALDVAWFSADPSDGALLEDGGTGILPAPREAGGTGAFVWLGRAAGSGVLPFLINVGTAMVLAWCGMHLLVRRLARRLAMVAGRWEAGDYAARTGLGRDLWGFGRLGRSLDRLGAALEERERRRGTDFHEDPRPDKILETVADAVVVLDEAGVIRSCNPAARRIFGHAGQELEGRHVSVLLPGWTTAERGARMEVLEVEGRCRDGSAVPLELSAVPWRDGDWGYLTLVLRDAARRRRTEADLRAARDEAERASRSKSGFLAAACHDLRQPVQSLLLFAAALDDRLKGHPAADIVVGMKQALDAHRLLLDGLLDISRLDAGVIQPKVTEFPLGGLLDRLGKEYALQAREKGLSLTAVGSRAWVRSDEALLERILRNLIENALRYTRAGRILVGCRRRGGALAISVSDTGIGIPDDQGEAIFEEFRQAERGEGQGGHAEGEGGQGLGLGLAIVRRLALLLGHEVRLRSRPGRGSEFTVEVPLAAAGTVRRDERADARGDGGGLALVIDDEAIILDGMRLLLEGWGYGVMTAMSCEEALDLLAAGGRPDVILADYRLREGGTGTEAIHRLRSVCGPVPGIVLTGDTAPERGAEARRQGFLLLHKPVAPDDLRRLLREVCA